MILKKFLAVFFPPILVIKTLDPYPDSLEIQIRIRIQLIGIHNTGFSVKDEEKEDENADDDDSDDEAGGNFFNELCTVQVP